MKPRDLLYIRVVVKKLPFYFLFLCFFSTLTNAKEDKNENAANQSKLMSTLKRAAMGLTVGTKTHLYPFLTLENGFDTYGHLIIVHRPAWNTQDRIISHLKHEPAGDVYVRFKYLADWFSDGKTRFAFSLKLIDTDAKYFYGIGNSTVKSNRKELVLRSLRVNAEIKRAISNAVHFIWSPGYWRLTTELDDSPAPVEPVSQGQYITSAFAFVDGNGLDYLGNTLESQWSAFVEFGMAVKTAASSYARFKIQTFNRIPILDKTKLGIGTRFEYLKSVNRELIPYFVLPNTGSRNGLRGFSKERFRNFATTSLSLEYAIPLSYEFETFILTDLATTASKPSKLIGSHIHQSFGVGFRLLNLIYPISAGVAVGSEGWRTFSKISINIP